MKNDGGDIIIVRVQRANEGFFFLFIHTNSLLLFSVERRVENSAEKKSSEDESFEEEFLICIRLLSGSSSV